MASVSMLRFLVTAVLMTGIDASYQLDVSPSSTTVMVGRNTTLLCTGTNTDSAEQVRWLVNSLTVISIGTKINVDGLIGPLQNGRLSITGDQDLGEYNLHFRDVQPEDAGEYSCGYFSFSNRKALFSDTATLTVIVPPLCGENHIGGELTPGSEIEMYCRSQNNRPNTAMTWLRNGVTLRGEIHPSSLHISWVLTEEDYDQPFTCVENMSPLMFAPLCSITPLRQTNKPVHIVMSPETVTVGHVSHLTCLVNQSFDALTYRWRVGSNVSPYRNHMISFGPLAARDNGTNITCEVYRGGELYGSDTINIAVFPSRDVAPAVSTTPSAETETARAQTISVVDAEDARRTANAETQPTRRMAADSFKNSTTSTRLRTSNQSVATSERHPDSDSLVDDTPNLMDNYMIMIFIGVVGIVGVLLFIAIVCLTLVLIRKREVSQPSSQDGNSRGQEDSFAELVEKDTVEPSNDVSEANTVNECIEAAVSAASRRHYFTLEPDSRRARRKDRKVSDPVVAFSKNRKSSSKGNTIPRMGLAEEDGSSGGAIDGSSSGYAVITVGGLKVTKSAKRPLPERPNGGHRAPVRSYSESKKGQQLNHRKKLAHSHCPQAVESSAVVKTTSRKGPALIIDAEYTEVDIGTVKKEAAKYEEKPYEFTVVYDALQDDLEKVILRSNPDSGYHDCSSTEGAELEIDSDGQRSEGNTSLSDSSHLVKIEAEDNLYASLEDCSVLKE